MSFLCRIVLFALTLLAPLAAESKLSRQELERLFEPEYSSAAAATRYLHRLAQQTEASDPPELIADLLLAMVDLAIGTRAADRAHRLVAAGMHLAEALGDHSRLASFRMQHAAIDFYTGKVNVALAEANAAMHQQRALRNASGMHPLPRRLFSDGLQHASMLLSENDLAACAQTLRELEYLRDQVEPADHYEIQLRSTRADLLLLLREDRAAQLELEQALRLAQNSHRLGALPLLLLQLGDAMDIQGQPQAAQKYFEQGIAQARDLADASQLSLLLLHLAKLHAQQGQHRRVLELTSEAIPLLDDQDDPHERALARLVRAKALIHLGKLGEAQGLRDVAARLKSDDRSARWKLHLLDVDLMLAGVRNDRSRFLELRNTELALLRSALTDEQRQLAAALRTWHNVSQNELRLALLERENSIRELENERAQARLRTQSLAIISVALLFMLALAGAGYFWQRANLYKRRSDTDALTGVLSRGAILDLLEQHFLRYQGRRRSDPLCLMLIDADDFKSINDQLGHLEGDRVLVKVVESIKSALRSTDRIGRIGGDEFMVILPGADLSQASEVAERIQSVLAHTLRGFAARGPVKLPSVSVSIGLAAASAEIGSATGLIEAADRQLLRAKEAGRGLYRPERRDRPESTDSTRRADG